MAKGNFNACFAFTIGEEGQYQDHENDAGNWSSGEIGVGTLIGTCWGISAPTLISWVGHEVTAEDMKNLSFSTAKAIYTARYWNVVQGDKLPIGIDLAVWDFAVNAGPSTSVVILQRLVGQIQDGLIGPVTLAAVNSQEPSVLIENLVEAHDRYYESLASFAEDGRGWLARQQSLKTTALAMLVPKTPIVPTEPAPVQPKPTKRTGTTNMSYKFSDRAKEWTSYAGAAAAALAYALPMLVPADLHWIQFWQGAQMLVGAALIFVPQTAGTTSVENESWSLLKAFAAKAPPEYSDAMQPMLAALAAHLASAEVGAPPPVTKKPVAQPAASPTADKGQFAVWPSGVKPMVADPAAALNANRG